MNSRIRTAAAATVAAALSFSLVACGDKAMEEAYLDAAGDSVSGVKGSASEDPLAPREAKVGETVQVRQDPLSSPADYTITEMTLGGECRYGTRYDDPIPEDMQLLQVWSETSVPEDYDSISFSPPRARVIDKEGYTTDVENIGSCDVPDEFDASYSGAEPGQQGRHYEAFLLPEGTKEFKREKVRYSLKGLKPNTETPNGEAAPQEQ